MKAALYPRVGEVVFTEKEAPVLSGEGALIRVLYAGICGSDVNVLQGKHPTATYPRVPGHEFVGILEDFKGSPRGEIAKGDLVVAQPFDSCGICPPCGNGNSNVCEHLSVLGIHQDGGFAEYVVAPIDKVYRLPSGLDPKVGALTEPLAVAVHDVRVSGLKPGQNVLVIGGGPIGILIALVARYSGASHVSISELTPSRLEFIRSLGFDALDPSKEDMKQMVEERTKGKGFDIVYEVTGSRAGLETMTSAVKIAGTAMVIGMSPEKYPVDTGAMFEKQLSLQGVRLHSPDAFAGAVEIISSGALNKDLEKLIDKVFPLSEIVDAMRYQIDDKEHFKVLIDVQS